MSLLFLDTFAGISGDMVLGLLVDLGADPAAIEAELSKLPVTGWTLSCRREKRQGIEGMRCEVTCAEQHHHRTWADIDGMLAASALTAEVKDRARHIFRRIGEAEAKMHGIALESVHFHEVGALDSIVDVVGAAAGLHFLGVEETVCTPLPLSRGMVDTAHGPLPLPAPATLEILKGLPVREGHCDRELVTPTGAAIAAEIARFGSLPEMVPEKTGYGVGGRRLRTAPTCCGASWGERTRTPGCRPTA